LSESEFSKRQAPFRLAPNAMRRIRGRMLNYNYRNLFAVYGKPGGNITNPDILIRTKRSKGEWKVTRALDPSCVVASDFDIQDLEDSFTDKTSSWTRDWFHFNLPGYRCAFNP